jgi:outer membrane biosynthesis protein TonB
MDETVAVDAKLRSTYAPALQRCYRAALAKQPGVRGHLMLHITVNAAGGVEDLSITDAEPGLAACAKAAGAGWRFPIPRGPDGNPRSKTFRIGVMFSTP